MEVKYTDKGLVSKECVDFVDKDFSVYGYYGGSFFEVVENRNYETITCANKEQFLELYNLITEMKKRLDNYDNKVI